MNLKNNLRIIWAITAKDIADAIKNKVVQGVLVGVAFMMLSSQALSLLIGLKDEPTAYFWDQGKSVIIKDIVRGHELNFHPQGDFVDLKNAVSLSVEPVLGIKIPADFDEKITRDGSIHLQAYRSHWVKPETAGEVVLYFEDELTRITDTEIFIVVESNQLFPSAEGLGYPMMIALGMVMGVMIVGLILTPYLLVDERETHTLDAIMISPARITHLLAGKSLVGLFYSLTASLLIFVFSWRWIVHWDIIIMAVFLGGLCAVSIGLLVGTMIETPTNVNMVSGLLIAGFLIPTFLWTSMAPKLSPFILSLIELLPSIAMYEIVRQSFTDIPTMNVVWVNFAILLIWIIVIMGAVGWRIRRLDR
ncbi:ABC transporter permease [Chloroflexota bacterium]